MVTILNSVSVQRIILILLKGIELKLFVLKFISKRRKNTIASVHRIYHSDDCFLYDKYH